MKRPQDEQSSGNPPTKRVKSSQACASCRKQKTRCEQPEGAGPGPSRCHRCKVLDMSCSFEADAPKHHIVTISNPSIPSEQVVPVVEPPVRDAPVVGARTLKPEDLIPIPTAPWGPVIPPGSFDWSATPILAIQTIAATYTQPGGGQVYTGSDSSMSDILTQDQIQYLLEIFETRYRPWLNIPSPSLGTATPLLDLVRCTVTSRHLDPVTRSIVAPRLHKLTEDAIVGQIFNPMPSLESIHALLILSLWVPVGGRGIYEPRDGRLLVASAVSMAMNLSLSQSSAYAISVREQNAEGESVPPDDKLADLADAKDKGRLWLSLTNAESTLCLGTGRNPLSSRSEADRSMLVVSSFTKAECVQDIRLGIMARLLDLSEAGSRLQIHDKVGLDKFYREIVDILGKMDTLHRLLLPLPLVSQHDKFYFQMLLVNYHAYRILIINSALREVRQCYQDEANWYRLEHNGIPIISIWGRDAICSAEAVLVLTLTHGDPFLINTAPDNLYIMITYAVSFLVAAKFSILQTNGAPLSGTSDTLLSMAMKRLSQVVQAPDHIPAKCGRLVAALLEQWERTPKPSHKKTTSCIGPCRQTAMLEELFPLPELDEPVESVPNSDIFLDSDFWSTFMDNLMTPYPT